MWGREWGSWVDAPLLLCAEGATLRRDAEVRDVMENGDGRRTGVIMPQGSHAPRTLDDAHDGARYLILSGICSGCRASLKLNSIHRRLLRVSLDAGAGSWPSRLKRPKYLPAPSDLGVKAWRALGLGLAENMVWEGTEGGPPWNRRMTSG
ncbi:hypothetical protein EDB80DRAFT_698151 [Ilyonectria destructans]|nr:hypothetical protein EDB80DRAFT_698151 [Ilyonectria destructans]